MDRAERIKLFASQLKATLDAEIGDGCERLATNIVDVADAAQDARTREIVEWLDLRIAAIAKAEKRQASHSRGPYLSAFDDIRNDLASGSWKERVT